MNKVFIPALIGLLWCNSIFAQTDYSNRQQLAQRVNALSNSNPNLVKTKSLVKTVGGSDIWYITVGTGATDQKPAVAVVGGVDGRHLLGVEMAIGFAEYLVANAQNEKVKSLLDKQTFYIFPNMSPDATENYFASVKYERRGNARPVDFDRDGQVGEDGYDDLDGDGKITMMRIMDPSGNHIINPDDNRSMITADKAKGQYGQFLLLSEGIDNDKDGQFNEDGNEGIFFNRNTTYNYKNFQPGAGDHAVSEVENRALFDLLYDSFNIYSVVTFGPNNNLSNPPTRQNAPAAAQGGMGGRGGMMMGGGRITSWGANDAQFAGFISEQYKSITGTKDAPKTTAENGDFAEWGYYHFGRLTFSTPGWWVPKAAADGRGPGANRIEDPVLDYLKWAEAEGITNTYTPWKEYNHPDFPGKKVEIGGVHPYAMMNPPYKYVKDIVSKHAEFVLNLAENAPIIEITDVKTEKLDNGLSKVSLRIFNTGMMPTLTAVGERSYFLKNIAVNVKLANNQKLVSGQTLQTVGSIQGKKYVELEWLVQGNGKVTIEAGSPNTGRDKVEVSL